MIQSSRRRIKRNEYPRVLVVLWTLVLGMQFANPGMALGQQGALNEEVKRLIAKGKLGDAEVGVSVLDEEGGRVLANVNGGRPMTPASNMKILSSGAALMVLGADFVFRTELVRDGDRLIVRGSGDPALADPLVLEETEPKLSVNDVFALLAKAAKRDGMESVSEIIVDDRVFDREYLHADWPARNLMMPHSAEVSGLNFAANVLGVYVKPSRDGAGQPPTFSLEPEIPWIPIQNRAKTVAKGQNSPWVSREPKENRFVLRGEVRQPTQEGIRVPIHDAPSLFGMVLAQHLNGNGIIVGESKVSREVQPVGVRLANTNERFDDGKVIAVITTPINQVLNRCNSDSMNLYAESLLKRAGHEVTKEPGSWANGASVLRMLLTEKLGPEFAAQTTISDGSGISRMNSVSPETLTRWLNVMAGQRQYRDIFTESLAAPGSGTLRKRFQDVKLKNSLHAKSGFIDGVRTLSGYVVDPTSGRRVSFSVMINNIRSGDQTQAALDLHEDVVIAIDRWLSLQDQPRVGG